MWASSRPVTVVAAVALMLGACTSPSPEPDPEPPVQQPPVSTEQPDDPSLDERDGAGGTLRIGLGVDPISIDPRFVVDDEGELVVDALFDPLVRVDRRMHLVPAAAQRWEVDETGTEFTFHLREATFHDGTPVTADAFVRSFQRIADGSAEPESFLAYLLEPVEGSDAAQAGGELTGVEAVDDRTLVVRLNQPYPRFVEVLSHPSLVPLPEAADDAEAYGEQPVGNGPFLLAEPRDPGSFLRLSAFPEHHEPPLLDEVLFQIYPEDTNGEQRWEDLAEGQLQVAEVPPERFDDAIELFGASRDGYTGPGLLHGITSTVYLYGFDTTREPFDDPVVRRAISSAVDREALADEVMLGARVAATSIVPPPFPGTAAPCLHCLHDPDAAAAMLEEAEIELEGFTLTHNRGRTHTAIAERMADDIEAALDIEVELAARDLQPFIQAVRRGEVPVFRLGWDVGEPDASAFLYPLFHSSQVGLDNLSRYQNDAVDDLLELSRTTPQRAIALGANRDAERLIHEDAPAIPLLWYRHTHAVASTVQELYFSPLGRIDLSRVWLDPDA